MEANQVNIQNITDILEICNRNNPMNNSEVKMSIKNLAEALRALAQQHVPNVQPQMRVPTGA